jgi:hypothetical protein
MRKTVVDPLRSPTDLLLERDHWEKQDVGGWIILKLMLERWAVVIWTGLMWLRIGASGGLF